MKYKNNYLFDLFLILTISLVIYIHNLSPSVYGGDSGDLISAVITNGVPHPSGYPLYTILGILFTKLPINTTYAWKVGLISAFSTSAMVCVYYLLIYELTNKRLISFLSSLLLAFTYTVWLYAEITEVLSLNSLFIITILYISLLFIKYKKLKYFYLLSFLLGLSLTNNLTILLIFPSVVITILLSSRKTILKIKIIIRSILTFIAGLISYLYIPISARLNDTYSWGYAKNLNNFMSIILRKEYGWGINGAGFKGINIVQQLHNYYIYWSEYIHFIIPIFILLGLIYLIKKKLYHQLFLILTSYIMIGPFYLIYARLPIQSLIIIEVYEKFYLGGIIIAFILFPFGVLA